jgi:hypothetical protein
MKQVVRNLTDSVDGILTGKRYLLMDRDASFSEEFREALLRAGVKPVRIPPSAPNCNPHIERFMLSLKSECLDRLVLFGRESLRRATREYVEHYNRERNHPGVARQNHRSRAGGRSCCWQDRTQRAIGRDMSLLLPPGCMKDAISGQDGVTQARPES